MKLFPLLLHLGAAAFADGEGLCARIFSADASGAAELLGRGADVEELSRDSKSAGLTPLQCAVMAHDQDSADKLLARGADPNAVGKAGVAPLLAAAENGDAGIIAGLLKAGARVNIRRRSDGMTPLMLAASKGAAEVVRDMLSRGADRLAKDRKGRTAAELARAEGHAGVAQLLAASRLRRVVLPERPIAGSAASYTLPQSPQTQASSTQAAASSQPSLEDRLRAEAENGNLQSQAWLGGILYDQERYKEAKRLLKPAAEGGARLAFGYLGHAYYMGNGMTRDRFESYKWYALSDISYREGGERGGWTVKLAGELTTKERREAHGQIKNWLRAHGRPIPAWLKKER